MCVSSTSTRGAMVALYPTLCYTTSGAFISIAERQDNSTSYGVTGKCLV